MVKLACRARQLFIRILAVVKWAATTGKVNKCEVKLLLEKFILAQPQGEILRNSAFEETENLFLILLTLMDSYLQQHKKIQIYFYK